jgi:hypothetical protein
MIKNLEVFLNRNTVSRFNPYYRTGRRIKMLFWSSSILHTWEPVSTVYLRTMTSKKQLKWIAPGVYYPLGIMGTLPWAYGEMEWR